MCEACCKFKGFRAPSSAAMSARRGNFVDLAERLESGHCLRGDEREVVAKILRGEIRRARGRQTTSDAKINRRRVYAYLTHVLMRSFDHTETDALALAIERRFKVSRTTAIKRITEWRKSTSFSVYLLAESAIKSHSVGNDEEPRDDGKVG